MTKKFDGSMVDAYYLLIDTAFVELGKNVSVQEKEELAVFLTRTMGSVSRDYH